MERNGKARLRVLGEIAERFDLPADVVAGAPRVELTGDREVYLERHMGLLSYSETQIDVNTPCAVLRVRGEDLTLLVMTAGEVRVGGRIDALEWVRV